MIAALLAARQVIHGDFMSTSATWDACEAAISCSRCGDSIVELTACTRLDTKDMVFTLILDASHTTTQTGYTTTSSYCFFYY